MTTTSSPVTWLIILGWVVTIGNAIVPVVPPLASAIIGSVVAVATILVHGKQITAGKIGRVV